LNKEFALKLVNEIILYYDARSKKLQITENIVGKYQCGFRTDKSTFHKNQSLKQILEKTSENEISRFQLLIEVRLPMMP
jgi:hypothetical protein